MYISYICYITFAICKYVMSSRSLFYVNLYAPDALYTHVLQRS